MWTRMRALPATDQEPTEAEREQHPERWWPEDERADGPDRDGETRNEYGEEPVTLREEPDEERDQPEIAQRLRAPRLTHRWGRRVHGPAAHCDGRHPSISNEPPRIVVAKLTLMTVSSLSASWLAPQLAGE